MRILHFSDFHLNGKDLEGAEHNLNYMLTSLSEIMKERKIDLILFSGDMIDQGGKSYGDIKDAFEDFKTRVIKPILDTLSLEESRFIFTLGNHDIDREADDEMLEDGIEKKTQTLEDIVSFIRSPKIANYTARVNDFKVFESSYYACLPNISYHGDRFTSTFELEIDGVSIGISSLNTVWRTGHGNSVCLGVSQISENTVHLNDKDICIGITHYPIEMLKEAEMQATRELCAKEFDLLFNGHTHSGKVTFIAPTMNQAFLDVNAAGTLRSNTYARDKTYENSFQIIDCETGPIYTIRTYKQIRFQEFVLDKNLGEDGLDIRPFPDEQKLRALYEMQKQENLRAEENRINFAILPFEKLTDFVNRPGNAVMQSEFQSSQKIDELKTELQEEIKDYRIMALSGMGKTRIIAETFKDMPGVYYSREADCSDGLTNLLKYRDPSVIIIDNCRIDFMNEAIKAIDESGKKVRLITIHNVLTPIEGATRAAVKKLDYDYTDEVVEKMLSKEPAIKANDHVLKVVRERSGKIPYMAILLINAYNSKHNLEIDNPDEVLGAILSGSESLDQDVRNVLMSISLFEPLGFEHNLEDEFNYVKGNNHIHHIAKNQDAIDICFSDTIKDYINRQLIEKDGGCIRLRPKPLAEWLTESWLVCYGDDFADILERITTLEDSRLSERLASAIKRRFKEMGNSPYAKVVFDKLNDTDNGSFHNERIAFTEAGSQLFLSMGLVSPVAVAQNLYSLIERKSYDWLRDELDGDVRRNLVWALENICMNADAFINGAKCLAKLAVAENEQISNNATGQFLQLFHLFLSGTQADLKTRITLLQSLRENEVYLPLIVQAINSAFMSRGFVRTYTSGTPSPLSYSPNDYAPNPADVKFYWRDCAIVLKGIAEQKPELISSIMDYLPKHVSDFANMNAMSCYYDLIDYFGKNTDYQWPEMRDALSMYIQHWFRGSEEKRDEVKTWMQKLAPKSFFGRLKAAMKDDQRTIGSDYQKYHLHMMEMMHPFAEEFVHEKVYATDEVKEMMTDEQFLNHWFVQCVGEIVTAEQCTSDVLAGLLVALTNLPKDVDNNFIVNLIRYLKDKVSIMNFVDKLNDLSYKNMAASILGVIDNNNHENLVFVISKFNEGKYDNTAVNCYVRRFGFESIKAYFEVFTILHKNGVSDKDVSYPMLMDFGIQGRIIEDQEQIYLKQYKEVLLAFDFEDSYPYLSHQVVDAIVNILEKYNDSDFAKHVHNKVAAYLSKTSEHSHPFEHLYFTLLPKYQDVILNDLLDLIASEDNGILFYYHMYLHLGSGFGSGAGPLFQCEIDVLKNACLKHPSTLPYKMAQMCPVYEYDENGKIVGFNNFFLWLCDNFGDQERMLHEFSANMGTYSWSGIDGFSDFLAVRIPCVIPLLTHQNETVRKWAELEMKSIKAEVIREQGKEAYERMIGMRS